MTNNDENLEAFLNFVTVELSDSGGDFRFCDGAFCTSQRLGELSALGRSFLLVK